MDGDNDISSGGTFRVDHGAPHNFNMVSRPKNPNTQLQYGAPYRVLRPENPNTQLQYGTPNMAAIVQPVHLPGSTFSSEVKKRKGRPRRYGPNGALQPTLSPMPVSASIPLAGDLSGLKQPSVRPFQVMKKAHKVEVNYQGSNLQPHVMTLYTGEDIVSKIISFSHQEPHAICILSAVGVVSNVTLHRSSSPGGTLTFQGCFDIISLSGSFVPYDNGMENCRTGGISVTLAGPDGQILAGSLAGLLIAGSPVTLVLGSFMLGANLEHKPTRWTNNTMDPAIPAVVNPSPEGRDGTQRVNFAYAQVSESEDDASTSEGYSDDDDLDNSSNLEFSD